MKLRGPQCGNLKKELGVALQEIKQEQWFKDLDAETQQMAIEQQKACLTPPDHMGNCLLNIALEHSNWHEEARNAGWEDPDAPCGIDKKTYFTALALRVGLRCGVVS